MSGQRLLFYIIVGLIAIGILRMIAQNPGAAVIPVLVLGSVFLLYKYPPSRWKSMSSYRTKAQGTFDGGASNKRKTKQAKFRVIRGSKREDDDIPKYH